MITVAVVLAGICGGLAVGPAPGRSMLARLVPVDQHIRTRPVPGRRPRTMLLGCVGVAVPVSLGAAVGARAFWLSVPVMITAATTWVLVRAAVVRRRAAAGRREAAQACSVLATQVRIGQPPLVAVRSAAADCPVLAPAVAVVDLGGDPVAVWRRQALTPGYGGLAEIARAWQLSIRTGADMGDALDKVAEGLFEDDALGLVIASEAAGPRASGKIMAVLPLAGIGLGYAIGGDPLRFLTRSPYGWACLVIGTLLACAGVLWMERVADRAAI
ncbi:type II secretion system F family protein [Microlunatus sp. Gsoil 973]|uniref:type II secretion system F family protein n=1 Tax=Microlunatus sp. Gsoil 973 TaxID=2672569 RepID=UPI0012B47C30|nr:pilus assembly protein TadB [Microlunatus sp. Gsoil 973]QGN33985.1 pilus assembly protein TadB [Microlunatus sp. Gsoil 973]